MNHGARLSASVRRIAMVGREAWAQRNVKERTPRDKAELAFLPAHLELLETPPHPAARWSARICAASFVVVVLLGCFSRVDVVARAQGKLVPNASVKLLQAPTTGVVREIHVRDGDRVQRGQLLLKLDARLTRSDLSKAQASRVDAQVALARSDALLAALGNSKSPVVALPAELPEEKSRSAQGVVDGIWQQLQDRLVAGRQELARRRAEADAETEQIKKLQKNAPLARREADDYRELAQQHYVAMHEYFAREKAAVDLEHGLASGQDRLRELRASVGQQRALIESMISEFRKEQLDARQKASEQYVQFAEDEKRSSVRDVMTDLVAPVPGTVQKLSVHTIGAVVTVAQTVLSVVPDDSLEIEASFENKDVGFLAPGQTVDVKVDAFPYSRYGMLRGTVLHIANDASADRKFGLVFPTRIRLPDVERTDAGKKLPLTPGMSVEVSVVTGQRSLAAYFLSPFLEATKESMHER